jgi:hypothetical protein
MTDTTSTFPAAQLERLRRRAAHVRRVPDHLPTDGWSRSATDPVAVVAVFTPLRVNPTYVLRAYQFVQGGNGNGIVWALPQDMAFPEPEGCTSLSELFLSPPRPSGALDDVMDAIDGDGSPWSYLCASLLKRELEEFGAMWHGCDWSTHDILGSHPFRRRQGRTGGNNRRFGNPSDWSWVEPPPTNWAPLVRHAGDVAVVSFYTFTGLGQEQIVRHTDTYRKGRYRSDTQTTTVATGPHGYVF